MLFAVPAGHGPHVDAEVPPLFELNVPGEQSAHTTFFAPSEYEPGAHSVHADSPGSGENEPAPHAAHVLLVASTTALADPASHCTHASRLDDAYVPAPHCTHVDAPAGATQPGAHAVHLADSAELYDPAAQVAHTDPPCGAYVPAAHTAQAAIDALPVLPFAEPAGHGVHVASPVEFAYVPTGQFVQPSTEPFVN